MAAFLLSVHVLAAIVFIGPVTVAAGMFPRYARLALTSGETRERAHAVVGVLHRISRVYGVLGLAVPALGIATGARMGVLAEPWLVVSMILTAGAATLLLFLVVPGQQAVVEALDAGRPPAAEVSKLARRLAVYAGLFALTWSVVVVLMITRPGSTTGV